MKRRKTTKRERLTEEDIINAWLFKYHGITASQLVKKEPELVKTPDWFKKYAVTQKQHDEWREWLIKALMVDFRLSRKVVEREMWAIYLNLSPSIISENN